MAGESCNNLQQLSALSLNQKRLCNPWLWQPAVSCGSDLWVAHRVVMPQGAHPSLGARLTECFVWPSFCCLFMSVQIGLQFVPCAFHSWFLCQYIEHVKFCYPVCFRPSDEKSEDTPPAVISSAWQNHINENIVWLRLCSFDAFTVFSLICNAFTASGLYTSFSSSLIQHGIL